MFLAPSWLVLVMVFLYTIYKYFTMNNNFWKDRDIPFEKPRFFFGNYFDLLANRKNLGELYRDIYNKYRGSRFVGVFQFQKPNLLIRDPDDIKTVMISEFSHFQDRAQFAHGRADRLSENLFNVESDKWKPMRQIMSPSFTTGKLKNMFNLILEMGDQLTVSLDEIVKKEQETECREVTARFTTDVIASCAFGIRIGSILEEDAEFRRMGRKIFELTLRRYIGTAIRLFNVNIFRYFKLRIHDRGMTSFFENAVKNICMEREKTGIKRNDFIDILLEVRQREQKEKTYSMPIDDHFIAAQAFVFFAAGFETSSTLMAFVLHQLAYHPEIQDKVAEEIHKVLNRHDGKISYETLKEITYLDMVICETQRFFPALGTIQRICTSPYTFPGSKLTVEKGQYITIPVYALHFDPKYYPNPDKFIPERFSPEAKKERHPMVFLPFGEGPRNCIGLRFGQIQSKLGLVSILKDFAVKPSSKSNKNIRIDPKSFVSAPIGGIWLNISRR